VPPRRVPAAPRAAAAALALAALAGGCAGGTTVAARPEFALERGRSTILIVPGPRDPEAASTTREAARLLTGELGARFFNVVDVEFVLGASPELAPVVGRLARQAVSGQLLDRAAAEILFQRHGIGQVLVVDVFRYEQYWGRDTKITRVGIDARLVHVAEGRILWHARSDPEYSGSPGHAFDAAARRGVRELVRAMTGELPDVKDTPLANWPIIEHFMPN